MRRRFPVAGVAMPGLLMICATGFWAGACVRRGTCTISVGEGGRALGYGALLVGGGMLVVIATRAAWLLAATARAVVALRRCTWPPRLMASVSRTGAKRVVCLRDDDALAFSAGTLRPTLHVTDTLVACLRPAELDSVLLHERAHAHRRDPLRQALRRSACEVVFFLPVLRWWDRRRRDRAELAADRRAIEGAGRGALAGALWVVGGRGDEQPGSGFGDSAGARVAHLLGTAAPRCRPRGGELLRSLVGSAGLAALAVCSLGSLSG